MRTLQEQARALGDPTRHRIFRYIAEAPGPVGVAELTAHLGLHHNAIRQHLAKLVAAGLVIERTAAPAGPGRPRLEYRVDPGAESRWGVEGPYERLSRLLSEVIRGGTSPEDVGRQEGRRQAAHVGGSTDADGAVDRIGEAMARDGFDPDARRGRRRVDIVLRRCPFERTALIDPDTVCSLHLGLARGLVDEVEGVTVRDLVPKDPRRAGCRLVLDVGG